MNDISSLFDPLPKGPISEIIVQRISDALIDGKLRPGDKIPTEQEFSERLGVGRNAVREAIKVLVSFGVLEIRRSEGTFVVEHYQLSLIDPMFYGLPLTDSSLHDVEEFKLGIYQMLLYLAIRNATDEEIVQLRDLCNSFRIVAQKTPPDEQEMLAASEAYNYHLGQMSHNPLMISLNQITIRFARYTRKKAIFSSLERGEPELLPNAYAKDLPLLESRDKEGILPLIEERMVLWSSLLDFGEQE